MKPSLANLQQFTCFHKRRVFHAALLRSKQACRTSHTGCLAHSIQEAVDEGDSILNVVEYLETHTDQGVPGVYAIYDSHRAPQLISFSEDMFIQIKVFANAAMATPENMEREAQHWLEREGGVLPPGNGADSARWSGQGDFSSGEEASTSEDDITMVSPFLQATVHRAVGANAQATREMTVHTVDEALNDIRGYLFSDGGDIDVLKVEDGNVYVRFQGNCASCSAQETTIRMGVSRSLRAAFGSSFREVIPMDPPAEGVPAGVTVDAVNSLLDLLRPAVKGYGGSVTAKEVLDGVVYVEYQGPDPIWIGVRSAIRDKFPDAKEVVRL